MGVNLHHYLPVDRARQSQQRGCHHFDGAGVATEYTVAGGTVSFTDTYNGVSEVLGTVQVQSPMAMPARQFCRRKSAEWEPINSRPSIAALLSLLPAPPLLQSVHFIVPYSSATALATTGTAPGLTTFTGTVSAFGPSAPTGNVTFTDTTSNFVLGSATLNPATLQNGFTAPTSYPITGMNNGQTGSTNGPAEGDFNGDGRPDLLYPRTPDRSSFCWAKVTVRLPTVRRLAPLSF